jgi:predicted nucleic acid-binding protein
MNRVLLDTNIYGELVIDRDANEIIKEILEKKPCVIYGMSIIRKELRDTPKSKTYENKKLRLLLLGLYDQLINKHEIKTNNKVVQISESYFIAYSNLGGAKGKKEMLNDLLIVACATLNNLDIVVSDDCHSFCSEKAMQAYKIVNALFKLRTPKFIRYLEFKRWFV